MWWYSINCNFFFLSCEEIEMDGFWYFNKRLRSGWFGERDWVNFTIRNAN